MRKARHNVIQGIGLAAGLFATASLVPAMAQELSKDEAAAQKAVTDQWKMLDTYCGKCHNATDWAGGVAFDILTPDGIPTDADTWEHVVVKLRGRLMPPPGQPQPPQKDVTGFISSLEHYLDAASAGHTDPGRVVLHRLNRTEYAHAVKDLLALDIDATAYLPKDDTSGGFDNVADVLKVSPTFLDQYILAARELSMEAVGRAAPKEERAVYEAPDDAEQAIHVDGLPLGTRGGMLVSHYFPADAQYEFNLSVAGRNLSVKNTVIMTIDGKRVFEKDLGGAEDQNDVDLKQAAAQGAIANRFKHIKLSVPAGEHKIGITFLAGSRAIEEDFLAPYDPLAGLASPAIREVEILGPYNATGVGDTASRRKIFICQPGDAAAEGPCAKTILSTIATKAYRRPVTDEDMAPLMAFYEAGRKGGTFDEGIQRGIMAILASPKFLYRGAEPPKDAKPGDVYRISDYELASRLSFFLWSTLPDDRLRSLAGEGKLHDPVVLKAEVKRMLADPRAHSLVTNFAFKWLKVDNLATLEQPLPAIFPTWDGALRRAFSEEMDHFIGSVLDEDRSVLELLTSRYTWVNERLAKHYGIDNVQGDQFRKVELKDPNRWGLLGKGAVLLVSSYPNRTSPVLRGNYVLENLTGTPPEAPPAGVNTALSQETDRGVLTVRQVLEIHRASPSCNACHGIMDPLGISLENFDAIGHWRQYDALSAGVIDSSGLSAGGVPLNGPSDLRAWLMAQPEQFVQTMTEKLMTYALGRTVKYYDMPTVRRIVAEAEKDDYRFSDLVNGIIASDAFQKARVPDAPVQEARAQ